MSNDKKFFWHELQELFAFLKDWLDNLEINNTYLAKLICQIIPASCPFATHIRIFNRTIVYIPSLCKLNPFYQQFVGLRFRCLCYLAEH